MGALGYFGLAIPESYGGHELGNGVAGCLEHPPGDLDVPGALARVGGDKAMYTNVLGAFAREMEADNLKARLALLGVDAKIQSTTTEKGLLHRVRIGPLGRSEDVDRLRAQLKAEGMNPTPVKAD